MANVLINVKFGLVSNSIETREKNGIIISREG